MNITYFMVLETSCVCVGFFKFYSTTTNFIRTEQNITFIHITTSTESIHTTSEFIFFLILNSSWVGRSRGVGQRAATVFTDLSRILPSRQLRHAIIPIQWWRSRRNWVANRSQSARETATSSRSVLPAQNDDLRAILISACVLIRSHPPAHAHRPTNNRRVCALLRLALCVLLPLIATALTSNYRRRMWCVYQLIRARIQGDAHTLLLVWISTLLTLLLWV